MNNSFNFIKNLKIYNIFKNEISLNNQYIISAPTGSGKSLGLPAIYYEKFYNKINKIYILEPRRLACKMLWQAMKSCGYDASFYFKGIDREKGLSRKIVYLTDGMFLNIIKDIKENDIIILDEFHERNLNQDLILALLKNHPNLIITSATIDINNFYFDNFKRLNIEIERKFPIIKKEYLINNSNFIFNNSQKEFVTIENNKDFDDLLIKEILENTISENRILVFLDGYDSIKKYSDLLEQKRSDYKFEHKIVTLHSQMSNEVDFQMLYNRKKAIFLSTNIAQTSITVEDLDMVIVSGFKKELKLENHIETLATTYISVADIKQQVGRVGRIKEGKAIIFNWGEHKDYVTPEILRIGLENSVLRLLHLGYKIENLDLIDTPQKEKIEEAYNKLKRLNLIDNNYNVTEKGEKILRLGLDINFGSLILEIDKKDRISFAFLISILDNIDKIQFFNREKQDEINLTKRKIFEELKAKGDIDYYYKLILKIFVEGLYYDDYLGKYKFKAETFERIKTEYYLKPQRLLEIWDSYRDLKARLISLKLIDRKDKINYELDFVTILKLLYKYNLIYLFKYYGRYKYEIVNFYEYKELEDLDFYYYIHPSSISINNTPDYVFALKINKSKDRYGYDKYYFKFTYKIEREIYKELEKEQQKRKAQKLLDEFLKDVEIEKLDKELKEKIEKFYELVNTWEFDINICCDKFVALEKGWDTIYKMRKPFEDELYLEWEKEEFKII